MNTSRKEIPISVQERAKNKDMIEHLLQWPLWPILPLKRYRPGASWPEVGFLHGDRASDEDGIRVHVVDMYSFDDMSPAQRAQVEVEDYKTIEDLLNAGWVVD